MELWMQILPGVEAKRRFYRITTMWVIDDKSGSLLANAGDLAYMGEPLIIVTACSIFYVGRCCF